VRNERRERANERAPGESELIRLGTAEARFIIIANKPESNGEEKRHLGGLAQEQVTVN